MPEPVNSSFIPKRNPAQPVRRRSVRKDSFFTLTLVSTALVIAAPIASGAVFIYQKYSERLFAQAVAELDQEIVGFRHADLLEVQEFDQRLRATEQIINQQISYTSVLTILEQNVTPGVQFVGLRTRLNDDGGVTVIGDIVTDQFDAALFQREILAKLQGETEMVVQEFTYLPPGSSELDAGAPAEAGEVNSNQPIRVTAEVSLPQQDVVKSALPTALESVPVEIAPTGTGTESGIMDTAENGASDGEETSEATVNEDTP